MARDQRTRLNAELAHQYNGRKRGGPASAPGRSSLTESPDGLEVEATEEADAENAEPEMEAGPPERESRKSIFELPRKEPSRQPLPGDAPPAAAPASPAAPSPAPGSTRRR